MKQNKTMILLALVMIFFLTQTLGVTYALVMGAGDYRNDEILALPAAIKDAKLIRETLIELEIVQRENIVYIENPVLTDFKFELKDFLQKGEEGDTLIFYFSGHSEVGMNENEMEDTYLCGVDVRKEHLQETAFNFRQNMEELTENLKSQETLMIFDTCYAAGITKERNLKNIKIEKKGFEEIANQKSINFLFSSGPEETSLEKDALDSGGWYTYYLIEGLKGGANQNDDKYIDIEELSEFVEKKVSQSTKGSQNPISIITKKDLRVALDGTKKYELILNTLTKEYFSGNIEEEKYKLFGEILSQPAEEDTEDEKEIRGILSNFNEYPTLGVDYLKNMTEKYLEKKELKKMMRIVTEPSEAMVFINGDYEGMSPLLKEFEEGTYEIEIKKEGYKDTKREITVASQTKDLSRIETINIELIKVKFNLVIETDPIEAYVYIDGEYKGTSPLILTELLGGNYEITIKKEGYTDMVDTINIHPEMDDKKEFLLKKETIFGSIQIDSEPNEAAVYLDNIYQGKTPYRIENVSEGNHNIKLIKEGFQEYYISVYVEGSKTIEKSIKLEKETGILKIETQPAGAEVFLDGHDMGKTPLTIENLEKGYYKLVLKKAGYLDNSETIYIEGLKQIEKSIVLEKEEIFESNAVVDNKIIVEETGTGSLKINGFIGKEYFIDDKYCGWIIPKEIPLKAGNHRLKINGIGEIEILISSNETTIVDKNTSFKSTASTNAVSNTQEEEPIQVEKIDEMVLVQRGTFQMGDTHNDGYENQRPVHQVEFTYDYWIGQYEITFDKFDEFCDQTDYPKPSNSVVGYNFGRGQRPVIKTSWWDATEYCNWLSEKEGLSKAYDKDGNLLDRNGDITKDITQVEGYRLPTEAEWEYAAREGHKSRYDYRYSGSNNLNDVGWYATNSSDKLHFVGEKKPNELGIYDMSGNVWEWCHDKYGSYTSGKATNPIGSSTGKERVLRGGCWFNSEGGMRVNFRNYGIPGRVYHGLGFRIARTRME